MNLRKRWRTLFRYRWINFKRRFTIYFVLTNDQCWYGFHHTQMEVLSWLSRCDLEAQKRLHAELGEMIADKEAMGGFRK